MLVVAVCGLWDFEPWVRPAWVANCGSVLLLLWLYTYCPGAGMYIGGERTAGVPWLDWCRLIAIWWRAGGIHSVQAEPQSAAWTEKASVVL